MMRVTTNCLLSSGTTEFAFELGWMPISEGGEPSRAAARIFKTVGSARLKFRSFEGGSARL